MTEQGTLPMNKPQEISDEQISRCADMRAAVRLCVQVSGLEVKEVAFLLGVHKDHLSRMLNPSDDPRHFPVEMLPKLMDVCRNEVPLRWLVRNQGYGLYRLKTAVERENEELRAALIESQREREMILKVIKEIRS